MATTVTSKVFDDDFKGYMTYETSSTATAYKVKVTSSGVYVGCGWTEYPWKTTLSATGYDTRTGTLAAAYRTKGYHGVITKDKTYSWTRKTSAYTVTIKVVTKKNTSDKSTGEKSVTFTVPALAKYTISYNANGGTGAPGATTKYYGIDVKLSSTAPTRTGYTFQGWSVPGRDYTDVYYNPGGNVAYNGNQTLVAVWKANTYTVTFNANGGTNGSVTSKTKTYDAAMTLPTAAQSPTRTYYKFLGWSASKTATTATWAAGASYKTNITANTTLYAVWKEDYIPPKFTSKPIAKRTDSSGKDDDEGDYGVVTFTWANGTMSGSAVTPTSIIVQCSVQGANSWTTVYTAPNFTTKTITTPAFKKGSSALDGETQYDIKVTITDQYGNASESTFISKAQFIIDVNEDGSGISIGAACSRNGFSTAWDTYIDNGKAYYGTFTDGKVGSLAYINPSDNTVFGYGGYNLSKGRTNVYGNAMSLNSKAEINITSPTAGLTNRAYGVNKVIGSGPAYMTVDQTVTLTEAITAQPNGIVLVFSYYTDGAASNVAFNYCFVPKQHVTSYNGCYVNFVLNYGATLYRKCIYIQDTKLVGSEINNNAEYTLHGKVINQKSFVLRQVIGV